MVSVVVIVIAAIVLVVIGILVYEMAFKKSGSGSKPEVFVVVGKNTPESPFYQFTPANAPGIALQMSANGTVATMAQLQDAFNAGAGWCAAGWVNNTGTAPTASYPNQKLGDCGQYIGKGVQTWANIPNNLAGVTVWGIKPKASPDARFVVLPFNSTKYSQHD